MNLRNIDKQILKNIRNAKKRLPMVEAEGSCADPASGSFNTNVEKYRYMAMCNLGRITFPPRNVDCSLARRIISKYINLQAAASAAEL